MTPALQSAAARIAMAFCATRELAEQEGLILEQTLFATVLRHPLFALSALQRQAVEKASEQQLIMALWRVFASGRFDQALGREQPAHQSH